MEKLPNKWKIRDCKEVTAWALEFKYKIFNEFSDAFFCFNEKTKKYYWYKGDTSKEYTEISLTDFKRFVLRDYSFDWCIKGCEKLQTYFMSTNSFAKGFSEWYYYFHKERSEWYCVGAYTERTIITFEEFETYIMKKEKEFIFPEKWCIKITNQKIADYCNKYGANRYYVVDQASIAHFPSFYYMGTCTTSFNIQTGYTLITEEQFEKYVLKEEKEMEKGYSFNYILEKEETMKTNNLYQELQATWVKTTGVKVGDRVKILSSFIDGTLGFQYSFNSSMIENLHKIYTIKNITIDGILLDKDVAWPFFVLELQSTIQEYKIEMGRTIVIDKETKTVRFGCTTISFHNLIYAAKGFKAIKGVLNQDVLSLEFKDDWIITNKDIEKILKLIE